MSGNLLIIDDDVDLTDLLMEYFKSEQFTVQTAHDGETGIRLAIEHCFDAIILDVMLPGANGFEVLKAIRERKQTPVLMLTARGDAIDKVVGLEIGADDYLPKPCNPRELIARLKAILRRTQTNQTQYLVIEQAEISIDTEKRTATLRDTILDLTNTEFNILDCLVRAPGKALSKEELTIHALNRKFTAYDRSIDVHVSNLRSKLGLNKTGDPFIKTVRGFGYLFDA